MNFADESAVLSAGQEFVMTNANWMTRVGAMCVAVVAIASAAGCHRSGGDAPAATAPSGSGENTATHEASPVQPVLVPVTTPTPAAAAPTASGPHAELTGEHHVLVATLAPPGGVPGDGDLTVEVRGASGYHVNNLYPVALDLQATNATAPASLHRADVAQLTQEVASFHVPVHVTGAGATVTGTMRFAVCSEQNCVPQTQAFAVALP